MAEDNEVGFYKWCHYCGDTLADAERTSEGPKCQNCDNITWMSVPSVPVLIVPADPEVVGREHGVYTVRRGIPPFVGELALPGGFQIHYFPEVQETWQQAAVRETWEEIQVQCYANAVAHLMTESAFTDKVVGNRNLIIGHSRTAGEAAPFEASEESLERVVLFPEDEEQLCFSIHRQALAEYWSDQFLAHNVRP